MTVGEKVKCIADRLDGQVYEKYSGRGMYGSTCWGIVLSTSLVDKAISMGKKKGLKEARTDNMGLDMFVYWPYERG